MCARSTAGALCIATVSPSLDAPDRQSPQAQRVPKSRGQFFELHHTAGLGLFMDTIDRWHAEILEPGCNALVGRQHELFDQAIGPGALGLGHATHLSLLVKFDDRLGKIEIDGASLAATLVHQAG